MRENQRGSERQGQWHPPRLERPTLPVRGRDERPAPAANTEAQRARMQGQILEIQNRIQQEKMAVERMRREGLSWQAENKETTISVLEFQIRQLRSEIDKLAA